MVSLTPSTLLLTLVLATQAITPGTPFRSTAIPGSARTLISVVTTTRPDGSRLELMVVWRGTPGWFLKRGDNGSSGGGSGHSFSSTLRYGGTEVSFEFKGGEPRRLVLSGVTLDLGDHNVVLVDHVDAATGPRVVKSLRLDPAIDTRNFIAPAIPSSADLVGFLQCDVKLESVGAQRTTGAVCDVVARSK